MKNICTLLFALSTSVLLIAQPTDDASARQVKKQRNTTHITNLKEGALLVRLHSKQRSIQLQRSIGRDKIADRMERKQNDLNKTIIAAFRDEFDFCPVYFFYSDSSKNVTERDFDNVHFLDDSLEVAPDVKFEGDKFLTAEFTTIEQDTVKKFDYDYNASTENGLEQRKAYRGGPGMDFGALVIKTDEFVQMSEPFPYYVRTFDSLPISVRPKEVVSRMNRKLHRFYKKNTK